MGFGNAVGFLIAKVAEPPYVRLVVMLILLVFTIVCYFVLMAKTRTLEQIFLYHIYCPQRALSKERARQPSLIPPGTPVGSMPPLDGSQRPDLMVHHLVTQMHVVSAKRVKTDFFQFFHSLFSQQFIVGHPFYPHDPEFVWRVPVNHSVLYLEATDAAEHVKSDV